MDFLVGAGQAARVDGEIVSWVRVGDRSLNGNENNVLLRNVGESTPKFVPSAYVAGVDRIEDSRGVGVIDIDMDGDLDLVVQGVERPAVLLVNQGAVGNYLEVRLRGTLSNRDGIGARIEARIGERTLLREVTTTGGYITGRSLMTHFGLGDAEVVDVLTVHWPSGRASRMRNVKANQQLYIEESSVIEATYKPEVPGTTR